MRQRAKVIGLKGRIATIEVRRSTMCDGCEKSGGCGGHCAITGIVGDGRPMRAEAVNEIGAAVGDAVEVETGGREVLGAAALVFLFPILACILGYILGSRIFSSEGAGVAGGFLLFALAFLGVGIVDRELRKRTPPIRIVDRVSAPEKDGGED